MGRQHRQLQIRSMIVSPCSGIKQCGPTPAPQAFAHRYRVGGMPRGAQRVAARSISMSEVAELPPLEQLEVVRAALQVAELPPREQLEVVRAAISEMEQREEHGVSASLKAEELEAWLDFEDMLEQEADLWSRTGSAGVEREASSGFYDVVSAPTLGARKQLRDRVETMSAAETAATASRDDVELLTQGGVGEEGTGGGHLQLLDMKIGCLARRPLRVVHPFHAVLEYQAMHSVPEEPDVARAVQVPLLVDQLPALRKAQHGMDPLNPLHSWIGGIAAELYLSFLRSTTQPNIVLVTSESSLLAVVNIDPFAGGDIDSQLLSEYVRGWWPDANELPQQLETEMPTLLVSLQGPVLRVAGCAWLEQPRIEEVAALSIPQSRVSEREHLLAASRLMRAIADALKVYTLWEEENSTPFRAALGILSFGEAPWMLKYDKRFLGVLPLPSLKADGTPSYRTYSGLFRPAPTGTDRHVVIQLLFRNHAAAKVHAAWAAAGLAPELLETKLVTIHGYKTKMYMVVMPNLLRTPGWIPLTAVEPSRLSSLREPLLQALSRGHQLTVEIDGVVMPTVHGHPHAQNIWIAEAVAAGAAPGDGDILFVDFDCAGHNNVVTYPCNMGVDVEHLTRAVSPTYEDWPEGARPSRAISHALDRAVLELSLRQEVDRRERAL